MHNPRQIVDGALVLASVLRASYDTVRCLRQLRLETLHVEEVVRLVVLGLRRLGALLEGDVRPHLTAQAALHLRYRHQRTLLLFVGRCRRRRRGGRGRGGTGTTCGRRRRVRVLALLLVRSIGRRHVGLRRHLRSRVLVVVRV